MKTVYFVRHGESEENAGGDIMGADTALSALGREQARLIGERLAKLPIEVLIFSSQRRAKETAAIALKEIARDLPTDESRLFVERIRPSMLRGKSKKDPEAQKIQDEWHKSLEVTGSKVLDGENFSEIVERSTGALAYLENRPESHIALVSHGYFQRALVARILFADALNPELFSRFANTTLVDNTGLTVIEFDKFGDKRWVLRIWNDQAHLG